MYTNKNWLKKELLKGRTQKSISIECGVHLTTIERYIKLFSLKGIKHSKESIKVSRMTLLNKSFCYFIGLFVTDGYFSKTTGRIEIDLLDLEPLKFLSTYFNVTFYNTFKTSKNKLRYRLCIPNRVSYIFKDLGFEKGAKTFTVKVPNNIPEENKKYVLRGIIDGDGTIDSKRFRIFSCSENIIKFVESFYISKNIHYTKYSQKNGVVIECRNKQFLKYIYSGDSKLAIPRKLNKVLSLWYSPNL